MVNIFAQPGSFNLIVIVVVNLLLAFFVNLSNFLVTFHTSPLTLQVAILLQIRISNCTWSVISALYPFSVMDTPCDQVLGCLKGVLAALFSWTIFGSPISSLGMFGYSVSIFGVFMYTHSKLSSSTILSKPQSSAGLLKYQSSSTKPSSDLYSGF